MRSLVPIPTSPPPLSRRERFVLLLLLPLWLPIFVVGVATFVVVGLLFAPDPPTNDEPAPDLEPDVDDDGLPDDYVPPFVPPPRQRPAKALPPMCRITTVAASPIVPIVESTPATPADADELDQIPACSWPSRFPGG